MKKTFPAIDAYVTSTTGSPTLIPALWVHILNVQVFLSGKLAQCNIWNDFTVQWVTVDRTFVVQWGHSAVNVCLWHLYLGLSAPDAVML